VSSVVLTDPYPFYPSNFCEDSSIFHIDLKGYSTHRSSSIPIDKEILLQVHSSGVSVALLPELQPMFVPFRLGLSVTDGAWHHVAIIWDGKAGTVTVVTDAVIVGKIEKYGQDMKLPD